MRKSRKLWHHRRIVAVMDVITVVSTTQLQPIITKNASPIALVLFPILRIVSSHVHHVVTSKQP